MGIAARQVERHGKTWVVHRFRFRRPPWRAFPPDLGIADPDEGVFLLIPAMVVYMAPSAEVAEPVVDQVARQLELGYSKIEPHRARFLGFDASR